MISTVRQAVEDLYLYLRKEQREFPPQACYSDLCELAATTLTGAMQEFVSLGPLHAFRRSKAVEVHAPKSIELTSVPASGRQVVVNPVDWETWMEGCSIQISGHGDWNEILEYDANSNTATLLNPIQAAAGTDVAATVYCDSLTLDSDVLEVIAPVMVADRYELTPVDGISAIRYWQYEDGYGDYGRGFWRSQRRSRQARGTFAYQPQAYFVDTYLREDMSSAEPALRMRVAPMPNTSMVIQYRAKIEPPRFTCSDVYDQGDPAADPGVALPVPNQFVESIFMPIARQRWTRVPYFRNDNAVGEIARQYDVALQIARDNRPQSRSGHRYGPRI